MNIENKMTITILDKRSKDIVVATGKEQLAAFLDLHPNTIHNYFSQATASGGRFENERFMILVSFKFIKGNRGRFKKS